MHLTSAMCWKLIARKVQIAIRIKQDDLSCLQYNSEQKLINLCDVVDDSKSSWNTPLKNCMQVRGAQTNSPKLPSRSERLSIYTKSLRRIGFLLRDNVTG
ncbi:hypothetical protein L3X38_004012 [Prunus dulcis]|uniref:Uncharacterized protein n=1 Tax=Prunus dulcis TaxID=3755 RepID=A0AAD5F2Q1_PRUDU|nr:hypothetical protein L3X38_004012 [Prunus dulcis]